LIRQQKLAHIQHLQQQQQLSQQFPQIQQSQVGIPRQPQLRLPLAQPGMQLAGPVRTPVESGLCSRRLMQYLYHKRHRPEVSLFIIYVGYKICAIERSVYSYIIS
jgi:hypothetical protein